MGIPLNNEETTCIQHSNKHTNNSVSDTKKREREREGERGGGGEGEEVKHVTIHISVQQVYKYRHASLIAAQTSDSICCCQKRQQHLPYSLPLSYK